MKGNNGSSAGGGCKNINDSSNSGNSSGDESDDEPAAPPSSSSSSFSSRSNNNTAEHPLHHQSSHLHHPHAINNPVIGRSVHNSTSALASSMSSLSSVSSYSSLHLQPGQPLSTSVTSQVPLYHPGFKFEPSLASSLSHHHTYQPFGDTSSLVMSHKATHPAEAAAMLHLSATGVDYSAMSSAMGSITSSSHGTSH